MGIVRLTDEERKELEEKVKRLNKQSQMNRR